MELIYLTNNRIPTDKAHGYQIAKMCEAFADVGFNVSLWLPTRVNTIKENIFTYYNVKQNFSVRYIKSMDYIDYLWLGRFAYILQTLHFLIKILFLKIPKKAIIYTRSPEIVFICNLKGMKVIYEDHAWPAKRKRFYLYLVLSAYKIIAITNGIKQEYEKRGFPKKIFVAPDGVDLNEFAIAENKMTAREKLNVPLDKKIVTYTGSFYLYKWKGVDVLLETEKKLTKDILLVLVGGNNSEIELIKKQYHPQQTMLVSKRPRNEVALFLKASDVLVLPNKTGDSNSEKYTSPLKLFEYMASGVPIVASALPSISEILNDENAYLVPPDDSTLLAQKLTEVLEKPQEAAEKALKAKDQVQEYTWQKRASHILYFILS